MDILITEELQSPVIERLAQKYAIAREPALWKDPAALKKLAAGARALMVRNQTQVTAELMESAPELVTIGRVGVGLDNIDVAAATRLGIVVIAPLNANALSVAELTIGLLLALARKLPFADRSTKAGGWDRKGCTGLEIAGKTLGICGLGRIGRLVAARARAFGMQVLAFDPFLAPDAALFGESGATRCEAVEQLLAGADFVTAHVPLTPETHHLFNAKRFASMKPGARFINTSRGGIVDESALLEALRTGGLSGAALDVRQTEPPSTRTALESMDNVILTPHIGAFTAEAQARAFEAVAGDLDNVLSGQSAVHFFNFDRPRRYV